MTVAASGSDSQRTTQNENDRTTLGTNRANPTESIRNHQRNHPEPGHAGVGGFPPPYRGNHPEADDRFPRGDPLDHALADAFNFAELIRDVSPAWHADALCKEFDLELWFPTKGQRSDQALQICGRCPVRSECLAEALADPELDHGIRGGLTASARRQRRKAGE